MTAETPPPPAITLVIPVYNERNSLRPLDERLRELLPALPTGSVAILVNDASTDGSAEILADLAAAQDAPFRLLRHERNRGYGASLKTGIAAAETEWIAISDADGTYPLERLEDLLGAIADGARMAVGQRPLGQQPLIRRPAKVFLNRFASYLSGTPIPDINSGLRVFRRDDALRLRRLLPDGFSLTTTITMALTTEGHRVDFLPITYGKREGRSKISPFRDLGRFTLLILQMAMAFNPLRVFGPAAAALIALGLALLVVRAFLQETVALATTVVVLIGGVQLLALGLLADLINRRGGG
ncbi:MAG: glycosyltransferase family 2 protein [Sumerlaeia bacterium]